jgi:hypothetical protein
MKQRVALKLPLLLQRNSLSLAADQISHRQIYLGHDDLLTKSTDAPSSLGRKCRQRRVQGRGRLNRDSHAVVDLG